MNLSGYIIFPVIIWLVGYFRNRFASEDDMFVHIPKSLARILGHSLENLDNLSSVPVSVLGATMQLAALFMILLLVFPINYEAILNQTRLPEITVKVGILIAPLSVIIVGIISSILSKD